MLEAQQVVTAILRLGFAVIVFAASLLIVVPPVTYNLWKASIAVTELGHLLAIVALLPLLLPGWWRNWPGRLAALLGIASIGLAISPIVRATRVASTLPSELEAAFGEAEPISLQGAPPLQKPFSFASLLKKPNSPTVRVLTIPFVERDGKALQLDLYKSVRVTVPTPIVVMIYGGSWRSGTKADLPDLNRYLAARGYAVAAVSYRLAPQYKFPAPTEDVNAAIDFLEANADSLGLDTTRIALVGRSAGGQLALLSAYTKNDPAIKGVAAFYPPTDQKWGWDHPSDPRVYDSFVTLREFLGGDPTSAAVAYRNSSPLNFVNGSTVPTLLIHGGMDPLVSVQQSRRLGAALEAAQRPHLMIELPWSTHGCDYVFNGPCGQLSTYAVERFLAAVLK